MKTQDCIFFQLSKASRAGARYWSDQVADFNVTAVQAMVLSFLSEDDEVTAGTLGKKAQLDSATLTGILDRLEGAGFVERRSNPDDRRTILVCLTEKGKEIAPSVKGLVEGANRAFLSTLTSEEELIFRTLLRKVLAGAATA